MNAIDQAYQDCRRAVAALDFEKANAHWRNYVALLHAQMNSPAGGGSETPAARDGDQLRSHDGAAVTPPPSSQGPGAGNLPEGDPV